MARAVLLQLAVAGVLLIHPAAAGIKHESFSDDPRRSILLDRFSSGSYGLVSISVTGVKASSTPLGSPDPSLRGFFLVSDEALFAAISLRPQPLPPNFEGPSCVLSSPYIFTLFTFADIDADGHYNRTFPVTHAGEYNLFFASCAPETKVTMDVQTHMYNAADPA